MLVYCHIYYGDAGEGCYTWAATNWLCAINDERNFSTSSGRKVYIEWSFSRDFLFLGVIVQPFLALPYYFLVFCSQYFLPLKHHLGFWNKHGIILLTFGCV